MTPLMHGPEDLPARPRSGAEKARDRWLQAQRRESLAVSAETDEAEARAAAEAAAEAEAEAEAALAEHEYSRLLDAATEARRRKSAAAAALKAAEVESGSRRRAALPRAALRAEWDAANAAGVKPEELGKRP